ncbi:MAG: hypothetical protein ACTHMS_17370 [Jatrophihabitans sp.]|uniref:hypothetical protein n=1 Tax=Jatrophihabitans sp. TaxID=1932789 RepID=UPI003F7E79F6
MTDQADVELSETEQDLLQLFYQCPVGLLHVDDHWHILRVNPAAVALLAPLAPGNEVRDVRALLRDRAPQALRALESEPDAVGRLLPAERVLVGAPGAWHARPVELQFVRLRPGNTVIVVTDISAELRSMAEQGAQLRTAQRTVLMAPAQTREAAASPSQAIAAMLADAADADIAVLLLREQGEGHYSPMAVGGRDAAAVQIAPSGALLDEVIASGAPRRVDVASGGIDLDLPQSRFGPVLVLPLVGPAASSGVAVLARRPGREPFTEVEASRIDVLTGIATLAVEVETVAVVQDRLQSLQARERAHRELLDVAIQHLYAAGLHLGTTAQTAGSRPVADRITELAQGLNRIIRAARSNLGEPPPGS